MSPPLISDPEPEFLVLPKFININLLTHKNNYSNKIVLYCVQIQYGDRLEVVISILHYEKRRMKSITFLETIRKIELARQRPP